MKSTVRNLDVEARTILLRADFNVPLSRDGQIASDTRIQPALATIKHLLARGARIIVCSHLGSPGGRQVDGLSMRVIARYLSELLNRPVQMAKGCIGPDVRDAAASLKSREILMLENLRFHPGEEANDDGFARALAGPADIYVNDAFGVCHRKHASIVGVPGHIPGVAGLSLAKELDELGSLLKNPGHPFGGLFGGIRMSDKVAPLDNVMKKLDLLLVGGAMAALFLKARGYEIGRTEVEVDQQGTARELLDRVAGNGTKLILPVDVVVASDTDVVDGMQTVSVENIPSNMKIVDIGARTAGVFQEELNRCRTVFWNGPMGVYEVPLFATGTRGLANHVADLEAATIIAGGSTAAIVDDLGLSGKMGFVSTGGGASLQFLSGATLPGTEILSGSELLPIGPEISVLGARA